MAWQIKKLGYSSAPWRLLDDRGEEVMEEVAFDHPTLGLTRIAQPICGDTKQSVIDRVLGGFVVTREVLSKRTTALRIIQTWASCDATSPDTREKAMQDIVDKCRSALS